MKIVGDGTNGIKAVAGSSAPTAATKAGEISPRGTVVADTVRLSSTAAEFAAGLEAGGSNPKVKELRQDFVNGRNFVNAGRIAEGIIQAHWGAE